MRSHFHFDHIGDVSKFPESTSVVVGPGTQEFLLPGYPAQEDAMILESDLEGPVREINFDDAPLEIGRFKALDYFGDGSFYLLDTPGVSLKEDILISALTDYNSFTSAYCRSHVCSLPNHNLTRHIHLPGW